MKKLILLTLILVMAIPPLAFGSSNLDGQYYYVFYGEDSYWLSFGKDEVMYSSGGVNTTMPYEYNEPFGNIVGVPFYIIGDELSLVFSKAELKEFKTKPEPTPTPTPEPNDPIDLNKVKWLHTDVSDWAVTANLKAIKIGSSTITVDYDKACVWPGESADGGEPVNANPWVFVNLDGTWYAGTWEWMKVCQTVKNLYAVDGSHIKMPPLDTWHPESGETYYFMVSGLARSTQRNVLERSNLLKVVWP